MALGLYTFHDTRMPLTCGSHTVKYAKITALTLKHTTPILNHNLWDNQSHSGRRRD